jgi:uncharacterized repeat protein (TIGR01451 family)
MLAFVSTLTLIFSIAGPAYASAQASQADSDVATRRLAAKAQLQPADFEVVAESPLKDASEGIFLIRLDDAPLATYRGGISGLQATSPAVTGERQLDVSAPASVAYAEYLDDTQATFIARMEKAIGHEADVRFTYTNTNNGLAVWLTPEEANQVLRLPGVSFVQPDFERELQTDAGPAWIGAPSIWGGTDCSGPGSCGEGIIVGVIDTGINPSNPSFADIGGDGYDHTNPFGAGNYVGVCDPGNSGDSEVKPYDAAFPCNDKLIGAWGYESIDAANGANSPLDYDGHGSHTASTAAGNFVEATITEGAHPDEMVDISGVAPHANIISYAGCCTGSALSAAIDQAVADGVDVINYSIGSPSASSLWSDFDTVGFLAAREAGIFVATSAGNNGPGAETVGSPGDAPWLTTAGASTHNRVYVNELVDMTGGDTTPPADISGKGFTSGYGPAPIVYAGDYPSATTDTPELCGVGSLGDFESPWPAGTFSGEIVVCDRGGFGRVEMGANVLAAGAGGYVLVNEAEDGDSLIGDAHVLPGVHISHDDGAGLKTWLASGTGHMATISGATRVVDDTFGDVMASFSSRGANRAIDLVSPSVTAPGVDIIAAKGQNDSVEWGFESGTSMSSPHVAGAGALLMQAHPTWTPAEIQSAMMLTADTGILDSDGTPADPFDMGNGRVALEDATAAGLIMSVPNSDYTNANPASGGDPKTLNVPSMANSQCVAECSWERTVTATTAGSWNATATADSGVDLTVSPTSFTLAEGESQVLTITADVTAAAVGVWSFGEVTLADAGPPDGIPDSHMPVAVKSSTGALPGSVDIQARRDAGSVVANDLTSIEITELTVETYGLTRANVDEIMLDEDPTNSNPYDNINDGTVWYTTVDVPEGGGLRLVAETYDTTAPDLDLYVGTGDTPSAATQVCFSATGSALEYCNIDNPIEGTYWVLVQNWESSGMTDPVKVATALVTDDEGNMLVEGPAQNPQLDPFDIRILWDDDMTEGDKFYGAFSLGTDAAHPGNIGMVPVDLDRVENDVTKSVDKAVADPGDTLTFTIEVAPNPTPFPLTYQVEDFIPEGFTYVPGSATGGLSLRSDGALTWSGTMLPPEDPQWSMSTSATDPFCDTGFGGYVDLETLASIPTDNTISGDLLDLTAFGGNVNTFFGTEYTGVGITDDGFTYFDSGNGGDPFTPQTIPDTALPNAVVAALWNDLEIVYDEPTNTGMTLAGIGTVVAIIEYDDPVLQGTSTSVGDFEVVLWERDDTPGLPEIILAYDNLNASALATAGPTTIGIENADGTEAVPFLNAGDASTVLSDGFQICYDWVAPLRPAKVLTYQVTVDPGTEGTVITNEVSHNVNEPGAKEEVSSVSVSIGDTTPPVDGDNLWATNVVADGATLNWDAATDDTGVAGYGIYQDGAHLADVSAGTLKYDVTGLSPETAYDFTVKAEDVQGNMSTGLMLEVTTSRDFVDDDFSIFEKDIEWLFGAGITKGCNPPVNDMFCPEDTLTRGQLAAMLNRALDLPSSSTDYFTDDYDSIFEDDINAVAQAGITLGCNPPANDNFCPDRLITRGEIAAMFDRALMLAPTTTDFFTDDDGNIFEGSINRMAAAGITKGCNPPDNDQYCPNDNVTRGQIAAFFRRALG